MVRLVWLSAMALLCMGNTQCGEQEEETPVEAPCATTLTLTRATGDEVKVWVNGAETPFDGDMLQVMLPLGETVSVDFLGAPDGMHMITASLPEEAHVRHTWAGGEAYRSEYELEATWTTTQCTFTTVWCPPQQQGEEP